MNDLTYLRISIPAVGRQLWHHRNSMNHHRQYPTGGNSKPPLDPPEDFCLQLVSHLQSYNLDRKNINIFVES